MTDWRGHLRHTAARWNRAQSAKRAVRRLRARATWSAASTGCFDRSAKGAWGSSSGGPSAPAAERRHQVLATRSAHLAGCGRAVRARGPRERAHPWSARGAGSRRRHRRAWPPVHGDGAAARPRSRGRAPRERPAAHRGRRRSRAASLRGGGAGARGRDRPSRSQAIEPVRLRRVGQARAQGTRLRYFEDRARRGGDHRVGELHLLHSRNAPLHVARADALFARRRREERHLVARRDSLRAHRGVAPVPRHDHGGDRRHRRRRNAEPAPRASRRARGPRARPGHRPGQGARRSVADPPRRWGPR